MQEASDNSLVEQFGFKPVSGKERIAQVDWTPKVNKKISPLPQPSNNIMKQSTKAYASVLPVCVRVSWSPINTHWGRLHSSSVP